MGGQILSMSNGRSSQGHEGDEGSDDDGAGNGRTPINASRSSPDAVHAPAPDVRIL